jgi:hypothetical protein
MLPDSNHRKSIVDILRLVFLPVFLCCLPATGLAQTASKGAPGMSLTLQSSDFANGGDIPRTFSCDGEDRSPALSWNGAPQGTKNFALIADDPDAPGGIFVHWVIFNIPAGKQSLPSRVEKKEQLADGSKQGKNSFGKIGYNGPCPPPGKAHRYFFKLYALDSELALSPGASNSDVERAMQGHTLAKAEWMGKYQR